MTRLARKTGQCTTDTCLKRRPRRCPTTVPARALTGQTAEWRGAVTTIRATGASPDCARALACAREAVTTTRGIAAGALAAAEVVFDSSTRPWLIAATAALAASASDSVRIRNLAFMVVLPV